LGLLRTARTKTGASLMAGPMTKVTSEGTDYERIGGELGLTALLSDFLSRVRGDIMIGFHFQGVDFARLLQHEVAFARQHLGGGGSYTGRPMHAAHAPHRIL